MKISKQHHQHTSAQSIIHKKQDDVFRYREKANKSAMIGASIIFAANLCSGGLVTLLSVLATASLGVATYYHVKVSNLLDEIEQLPVEAQTFENISYELDETE